MPNPLMAHNVEVAAVLFTSSGRLLVTHNPRWGSFSAPMSKRRRWQDPQIPLGVREEEWHITAARVAGEVFGRTFLPKHLPKPFHELRQYKQSDIDGLWKLYNFHLFHLPLAKKLPLAPGVIGEWHTAAELAAVEPVSPTLRFLLQHLDEEGKLPLGK